LIDCASSCLGSGLSATLTDITSSEGSSASSEARCVSRERNSSSAVPVLEAQCMHARKNVTDHQDNARVTNAAPLRKRDRIVRPFPRFAREVVSPGCLLRTFAPCLALLTGYGQLNHEHTPCQVAAGCFSARGAALVIGRECPYVRWQGFGFGPPSNLSSLISLVFLLYIIRLFFY
jgi:hypothetical protein